VDGDLERFRRKARVFFYEISIYSSVGTEETHSTFHLGENDLRTEFRVQDITNKKREM
jgi:hypothetical protein